MQYHDFAKSTVHLYFEQTVTDAKRFTLKLLTHLPVKAEFSRKGRQRKFRVIYSYAVLTDLITPSQTQTSVEMLSVCKGTCLYRYIHLYRHDLLRDDVLGGGRGERAVKHAPRKAIRFPPPAQFPTLLTRWRIVYIICDPCLRIIDYCRV